MRRLVTIVIMLQLYTYWRSSASWRVRIALQLKGLAYEPRFVHLVRDGGEQHHSDYLAINPQGRVPVLVDGDRVITQSLAIIEYLDETQREPALLPVDAAARAQARALAQLIACDIQPLQNTGTTLYLRDGVGADKGQVAAWLKHFIGNGLTAFEAVLAKRARALPFCHADQPGLADCCLVPQCFAARRFGVDVDAGSFPLIAAIERNCQQLGPFQRAAPETQPDRDQPDKNQPEK